MRKEGSSVRDYLLHDPIISSTFNADDTIIFGNYEIRQAMERKSRLCCFEMWSGLRINFNKISLIHLGEDNLTSQIISVIFSCRVDTLPIRYLGYPLRQGRLSKQDWDPLLDHLERRLEGWKGKYLFLAGRIILINVVLSAIPLYFMSVAYLPYWVINKIDSISRRFLWQRVGENANKFHLVTLGQICKS